MPFFANTPESLINRSDSKNPSATCRGITSSGRPCRRPIAASRAAPALPSRLKAGELRVDDPQDESLYCWQHKEQASLSARSSPGPKTTTTPILEERTSLDTLADRLGIVAQAQGGRASKQSHAGRPSASHGGKQQRPTKMTRPKNRKTVEFCCCFRLPIEEVAAPPPRPIPRPLQPPSSAPVTPTHANGKKASSHHHHLTTPSVSPSRPRPSPAGTSNSVGRKSRHSSASTASAQTAAYLALIPPTASPQTASLLMAELAKPFSQIDEPGYIYIFWLTPESQPAEPPAEAARSLLAPPGPTTPTKRPSGQRRPSDVLASFASSPGGGSSSSSSGSRATRSSGAGVGDKTTEKNKKKILLKIGRATNVQRRLNEWTRQCGYNLSLIRYYPYIPSSGGSSPGRGGDAPGQPRKVPHSHRVERLVHVELAGRGLRVADREKCDACGREHREWFEVEATREAVADVDEVVRRWVEWDEGR